MNFCSTLKNISRFKRLWRHQIISTVKTIDDTTTIHFWFLFCGWKMDSLSSPELASFIISTLQSKNLLQRIKIENVGKYKNSYIFDISINKNISENFQIDSVIHSVQIQFCPHLMLFEIEHQMPLHFVLSQLLALIQQNLAAHNC